MKANNPDKPSLAVVIAAIACYLFFNVWLPANTEQETEPDPPTRSASPPQPPPAPAIDGLMDQMESVEAEALNSSKISNSSPPVWLTWQQAAQQQQITGEPIIAILSPRDPSRKQACKPCLKLDSHLERPEVLEAISQHGLPCRAAVEDWETGGATLPTPTVCYVTDATESYKPPQLTGRNGLKLDSPDAFLKTLKVWIDGIDD